MLISIHSRGENLSASLRTWIEDRLEDAVARLSDRGRHVEIFLADENGPGRGGLDKSCRVLVSIAHEPTLVVADRDSNIARMIDRVADRVAQAVGRRCDRSRRRRA